jgi:hypothetical protein
MDEANGSEIANRFGPIFFWDGDDVCFVDKVEVIASRVVQGMDGCHDVVLNNGPTELEEASREAIRTWGLVLWHEANSMPNFIMREGAIK